MRQLAVTIGRFQFIHIPHVETLLSRALSYDSTLVLLGSSLKARDQKNPLRWEVRADMIRTAIRSTLATNDRNLAFAPIKDYPNSNPRWVVQVQKIVHQQIEILEAQTGDKWEPVLVGVNSDETSFYLKLFPQWKSDIIDLDHTLAKVSATDIRKAVFEGDWASIEALLPGGVKTLISRWLKTPEGRRIQEEYDASKKHRLVLAYYDKDGKLVESEHKPTFHTADNVVTWRGHVLLIRRRSAPGKGLWALPGGFIKSTEWIKTAAIRELTEETHVQFFIKGSRRRLQFSPDWCKNSHVFDHPGRSLAGRRITTAYHWIIPDEFEVAIRADDDAAKVKWFPIYDVLDRMDYELFEDHQSIVAHMALGVHQ